MTSIMATCPLLLGLLDARLGYADALRSLFPEGTETASIEEMLRPKELTELLRKVSVSGQSKTRSPSTASKPVEKSSSADEANDE